MKELADFTFQWIRKASRRLRSDSGANVMFEFAISLPFLVLMVVGTFAVGLMFDRSLTQGQLARNAANMYARGIRFNTVATQQLLVNAATGMNMQLDGTGDTVVYLTTLTRVRSDANCVVGGASVPCGNRGLIVMAQRFSVGNTSIGPSIFGAVAAGNLDSQSNVISFEHQSYARATTSASISDPATGLGEGEFIYAADVRHNPTLIKFPGIVAPEQMLTWAFY